MGNEFAYAILAFWPLVAIYLYSTKSIQIATLWTILGGLMFLPVKTAVNLPMIPSMDKSSIPVLSALLGCWFFKKKHISYFKELGSIKYLVILFFIIPFITASLNSDSIIIGGHFLPNLTYYDGLSSGVNQFLSIAPFFIGRQFFRTYDDQLVMFKVMVVAGLFYSLPILFEIRMSPQLHTWIYGYFPHTQFVQQIRFGGFRPVVFIGHGLEVAFFTATISIASVLFWHLNIKLKKLSPKLVSYYFLIILVLCKSIASIFYGAFAFVIIKKTRPKVQHKLAVMLAGLAILYPLMSITDIFPHETIVHVAKEFSEDRAQSLQFRFTNEKKLLDHARERIYFGWGEWGRNRIFNYDTGKDTSVTDGTWIITLGQFGMLGFFAQFSFLFFSVYKSFLASRVTKGKNERNMLAAHAILVAIIMIDQLPNSSLVTWYWLLTGILLGRSEYIIQQNRLTSTKRKIST